jgi:hypothetical protein
MTIRDTTRIAAIALAVGAPMACSSPKLQAANALELSPGVLVDAVGERIYLMSPDKTVDAVAVTGGETLWSAPLAARPLSISDGALVCQAEATETLNQLNLVVLDANQGGQRLSSSSVALPQNVVARIDDDLTDRFRTWATVFQDDSFISWQYQAIPAKGTPTGGLPGEPPGVRAEIPKETSGTVRLNVRTGRAATLMPADMPEAVRAARPEALTGIPGVAADPRQRISIDGAHTLRSRRVADDSVWDKYEWTIVDNQRGAEIGRLRSHLSQSAFIVIGSRVLFETGPFVRRTETGLVEEPRSVRARDLQTGNEVWSRPVRDTAYRGPFPP